MASEPGALCEYLDWDSNFFGRRIARAQVNRLDAELVQSIMAWCQSRQIDCLYFLCDADDSGTIRLAEDNGLRCVDVRVTFEWQLGKSSLKSSGAGPNVIRSCVPEDVPALRAIAQVSHRDTRFYNDPHFSAALCDSLYETWIAKSCNGYADAVLVAEVGGRPAGYVSCHLRDQNSGQIGLVGVSANAQGQGLGPKLVAESLRWFAEHGAARVTVVTQGRNIRAQCLYRRCGFLTHSVQLWYHWWFPNGGRTGR